MGNVVPSQAKQVPPSREVVTNYGPIIGRRLLHEGEKQVDAFQGIPFAKPPVGELRFQKPEPPEPWTTVRETKAFGHRSIQRDMLPTIRFKLGITSEDCLTLNVFTPVWSPNNEKGFPVLVYIHGGGFVSDSCVKYGDIGICKYLVTKDVVVVTLQYRLGYLGFFSTGDDVCPGNQALWDMKLGLEWVRDNIGYFAGDKDNITVCGQSAGGDFVDLLSISPHTRDLFHKVIPMAGNSFTYWSLSWDTVESCRQFAEKHGVQTFDSNEFMAECRKIPAQNFGLSLEMDFDKNPMPAVAPRIDGVFFPKSLEELRAESKPIPRIIGCARSEGLLMSFFQQIVSATTRPSTVMRGICNMGKLAEVTAALLKEKDYPLVFKQLRSEYVKMIIDVNEKTHSKETIKRALAEAYGDFFLYSSCQDSVAYWSQRNAPVYFYSFDYFNPKMFGPLGSLLPFKDSTHCADITYLVASGIISNFDFTEDDIKIIEMTTSLWTNFCKYGDPNGEEGSCLGDLKWLPVTEEHPQRHLEINIEPKLTDIYKNGRPLFLLECKQKYQVPNNK